MTSSERLPHFFRSALEFLDEAGKVTYSLSDAPSAPKP